MKNVFEAPTTASMDAAVEEEMVPVWSLDELFDSLDDPAIEVAIEQLEAAAEQFESQRGSLDNEIAADEFVGWIHQIESNRNAIYRVYAYAMLMFSANTQDQAAANFVARMQQLAARLSNQTMFFSLWWKALDQFTVDRLMADAEGYQYWLKELRHATPYTLEESEEKIINLKDVTGASALTTLYNTITNRYLFELEVDGDVKKLTRAQLAQYIQGADSELRAKAYQVSLGQYAEDSSILGQLYQYRVRDWHNENVTLRSYETPIAVRNLANDIPSEAVENLMAVCAENADVFQRYFKIKARHIGVEKLRRYDLYAPLRASDTKIPYEEAVRLVLEGFADFDPEIAEMAQQVFDAQHIDAKPRVGKRDGAFCMSVTPDLAPWVLQSYTGQPRDVATLAHEMGHAIHAMASNNLNSLVWQASLPLAETASTFSEMLLLDKMLAETDDEAVRRDLLFRQMDDNYATIMRQAFFARFEIDAHELVQQGGSIEALSDLYLENLKLQFGDSLELSDDFKNEWLSIPHIYAVPFYVYAYAFGQLLVLSLYRQYREEGASFIPRYRAILAAGGSDSPAAILQRAGIDITEKSFWEGGFDVLREYLEALEALSPTTA